MTTQTGSSTYATNRSSYLPQQGLASTKSQVARHAPDAEPFSSAHYQDRVDIRFDEAEEEASSATASYQEADQQPRSSHRNPEGVKSPIEGFDAGKMADPQVQSPKYIFGRIAEKYSLDATRSKEDAGRVLQEMLPDLQAAGLDVLSIDRDKLTYRNPETGNIETVDVVRAAGGDRSCKGETPAWQWQVDAINGQPVDGGQAAAPAGGCAPAGPDIPMTPELAEMGQKFMQVAQGFSLDDVAHDKKAVEGRIASMAGALSGAGVPVTQVCKDTIVVRLKDGSFQCVDVVQGAGAAGARWQWLPSSLPMPSQPKL